MLQEASSSNFASKAQSQTSYPSGPSRQNPPRLSIVGGYVIDNATCVAWGSRILDKTLNPEVVNDSLAALSVIMGKIEKKPYFTPFLMVGEESCQEYMVMTQSAPFPGWRGMDPELIPNFQEGEREAIARQLLEAEGITKYEFRTELY